MNHQQLISEIKARFDHHESKLILKEKYKNELIISNQGGMWTITPELLGYLANAPEETYLLDNYNNPIKIVSRELLEHASTTYETVMSHWHEEYQELSKRR